MWDLPMRNGLSRRCPRDHVELTKTIRNKLTADRSTTELRWIVLSLRLSEAYILPTLCQRASFCFAVSPLRKTIAGKIKEALISQPHVHRPVVFQFAFAPFIGINRARGGAAW
jgi:hypothetical protein